MLKFFSSLIITILVLLSGYGALGWYDATQDAADLKLRAEKIISAGRGADSLTSEQLKLLIRVQDPGFYEHSGVDFTTPGAGLTTLTQSLSKRLAFKKFVPGVGKVRQTGYALGLDSKLSKEQQIALFLETVEMGKSDQGWIRGFHQASKVFFDKSPKDLTDENFNRLVAVLIAPGKLKLAQPNKELEERVRRIARLAKSECKPSGWRDVWLEGCK